jgi:hypothetical protein
MGFIDEAAFGRIIDSLPKGEYRDYLRLVSQEGPSLYGMETAR